MAFDAFFCGMDLLVRVWRDADGDPAIANESTRHEVFIIGARAGGPQGINSPDIPEHKAHMAVPAGQLVTADINPMCVIESAAGPLAVWPLDDTYVEFLETADNGVAFRDRLRPRAGSPAPNFPGDWEDIAWVCDYERAAGTRPPLAIDLTQPPATGPASFIARLNAGMLLAQPPRRDQDRQAVYEFSTGYRQSLTDTLRWRLEGPPRIQLTAADGARAIIAINDGPVYFTSLSNAVMDAPIDDMKHFSGFGSLFRTAQAGPVPRRVVDQGIIVDGEVGWSGGICLCGMLNVRAGELGTKKP